jgi:N-acetyl-anhydromuramyl-L-alanine amidase AmpD
MLKIYEYGDFKPNLKNSVKSQIILCHTSTHANKYLSSITLRGFGKYSKTPNFLIKKNGEILKFIDSNHSSNFMGDDDVDKSSIVIILENLGWMEKIPLSEDYIAWDRNIYSGSVFEKRWRGKYYWDEYTEDQYESTVQLCLQQIHEHKLDKKFIGTSGLNFNAKNFNGIVTRSNYNLMYTDLNPSFNFDKFINDIDNG